MEHDGTRGVSVFLTPVKDAVRAPDQAYENSLSRKREDLAMNTVTIRIDEALDARRLEELKAELMHEPYVRDVRADPRMPHDLLVEFEEHHNLAIRLLKRLEQHGLHPDIQPC